MTALIAEVYPDVYFGSGLERIGTSNGWRDATVVIASPSVWPIWKDDDRAIALLFDDAPLSPADYCKIVRQLARIEDDGAVKAFLCFGGQNRSALMCGLWLWLHRDVAGPKTVALLQAARGPNMAVLNNTYFRDLLSNLHTPLLERGREQFAL